MPDSGIRQVVVRITSRQSTSKSKRDATGKDVEGTSSTAPAKRQDCTEYIVIQKMMWSKKEDDWRIWGQVTPTTVEELESPFFASGLSMADRLDAMKAMVEGKK